MRYSYITYILLNRIWSTHKCFIVKLFKIQNTWVVFGITSNTEVVIRGFGNCTQCYSKDSVLALFLNVIGVNLNTKVVFGVSLITTQVLGDKSDLSGGFGYQCNYIKNDGVHAAQDNTNNHRNIWQYNTPNCQMFLSCVSVQCQAFNCYFCGTCHICGQNSHHANKCTFLPQFLLCMNYLQLN